MIGDNSFLYIIGKVLLSHIASGAREKHQLLFRASLDLSGRCSVWRPFTWRNSLL